ncbi:MAG TPA: cyclase family protein [Streptosporangiaceae bacterium]|jgi:kynurenine formamidase
MSVHGTSPDPAAAVLDGLRGLSLVDLTLTIAEDLPAAWATHMPFQAKAWNWFRDDDTGPNRLLSGCGPYFTRWLLLDEHIGTHFDAPSHFIPPAGLRPDAVIPGEAEATSAEQIAVGQLAGRAAVIRVPWRQYPAAPGTSGVIGTGPIEAWERRYRRLGPGDVVLFASGWDEHYTTVTRDRYCQDVIVTGRAPGWPAPSVEVMDILIARGIRCAGTDAPSMGPAENGQAVHVAGLGRGMVFVEGLTRLDEVPDEGALFAFFPIKVLGGSGAPGRAIALVPRETATTGS